MYLDTEIDMNATFENGKATFTATHFSEFVVAIEDEATAADPVVQKAGLSGGAIAGIVIASIATLGIVGFCVYWFVLRKKKLAK